ncbi:nitrogen regulatory protein PII [Chloropicon primus]|uniref:Nitrogen regulatory protein PII n=1 Tax=Chloropicon primus TaxID=1764295 RepID=A0A5B8MIN9_9CHLO|nr:nitrogen regulatory protein PII [Chloropicon primus]|eukprot:QDZ20259.1 nitrogen regulatory protein PII [Chloropicon primus]
MAGRVAGRRGFGVCVGRTHNRAPGTRQGGRAQGPALALALGEATRKRRGVVARAAAEAVASLEAFPHCEIFEVRAIVRPWRQETVVSALLDVGVRGLTVSEVKGIGVQGAKRERSLGREYGGGANDLVDKTQISIVVSREQVQVVCAAVINSARTGEIGDGKLFIHPCVDVVRIRTKERGAVDGAN